MKKLSALFVTVILALALAGCATINPGNAGIVVDQTGSTKGVLDKPVRTGWVWYNPIYESVIEYSAAIRTVKWTQSTNEGRPVDESFTFTNKDSMSINADFSISYSLDEAKIPYFYVRFLAKDEEELEAKFTYGFLHNVARDCINEHAGKYDIQQIMGDNANFLKDSQGCIQDKVKEYGVKIDQFGLIGAPRPPQQIIESINMKAKAEQLALQKQMELTQVQADAAKVQAEAVGQANATVARAEGDAKANAIRNASITANLLEWRRLDNDHDRIWRWDSHLPQTLIMGNGTGGSGTGGILMQVTK